MKNLKLILGQTKYAKFRKTKLGRKSQHDDDLNSVIL